MTVHKPLFSIVVACKNEEKDIYSTIMSIIEQTFFDIEVIVIDGKSSDKTVEIVEQIRQNDPRVKIFSGCDDGVFDAMNHGIGLSCGDYIQFINAKDRLSDKYVLEEMSKIIRHDYPDIVIGDYIFDTYDTCTVVSCDLDDSFYEGLRFHWGVCHQAVIAKKEVLNDGFNTEYIYAADYDWFCRQYINKKKICKINKVVANYDGYGESSMAYNRTRLDDECRKIACKYFDDAIEKWEAMGYGTEKYKNKTYTLRAQYNVMNDLFSLSQRGYDFGRWFERNEYLNIGIYGMHHLGKRIYDLLNETDISISFVMDKNDMANMYKEYISPEVKEFPQVDCIIVTAINGYYDIKNVLEKKMIDHKCVIIPIEKLVARFKNDLYCEG